MIHLHYDNQSFKVDKGDIGEHSESAGTGRNPVTSQLDAGLLRILRRCVLLLERTLFPEEASEPMDGTYVVSVRKDSIQQSWRKVALPPPGNDPQKRRRKCLQSRVIVEMRSALRPVHQRQHPRRNPLVRHQSGRRQVRYAQSDRTS
jgi:hypothetical protein